GSISSSVPALAARRASSLKVPAGPRYATRIETKLVEGARVRGRVVRRVGLTGHRQHVDHQSQRRACLGQIVELELDLGVTARVELGRRRLALQRNRAA